MLISGKISPSYLAFVSGRADWLSLSGWVTDLGSGHVEVVAAGPEALVGALEMACILGPLDALIDHVTTSAVTDAVPQGFSICIQ